MNEALSKMKEYLSKKISDQVASDNSIVNLSIGEPYFQPPEMLYRNFRKSLITEFDELQAMPNKYSESKGGKNLRKEVANRYQRLYNAELDPDSNILITHGAAEAIWLSILTLTSIGDEIIIADPSYMLYEEDVRFLGRIPVKLPTKSENAFCLTLEDIRNAITPRTKIIFINSPENPTGAVYSHFLIKGIYDLARENNLYFVHDEVYDEFNFSGVHENIFRHQSIIDDTAVLINSFSKKFSMMGWRLGWMVASEEVIANAVKIHTNFTLNLNSFIQASAATILNDPEIDPYLEGHRQVIKNNVTILKEAMLKCGGFEVSENTPKGAFFIFPNVSKLFSAIPEPYKDKKTIGECVAAYLLYVHKIAVVPGIVYGNQGSDHVRVVAAVDENIVGEAAQRFSNISLETLRSLSVVMPI